MRTFEDSRQLQFLSAPGVVEVLLCAVTVLAYLGTLSFGFVYDDNITIVHNDAIRFWRCIPDAFTSIPKAVPFYRPLTVAWHRVIHALFGLNPAGWHLATLTCNVVVSFLAFVLVCRLVRDRTTGFIAGLLFALYPLHAENVAWLSAAGDLLMSVFLLGSFLAFLKYQDEALKRWLAVSAALFACSLLAKETAAILPGLVFAFALIFNPKAHRCRWFVRIAQALQQSGTHFLVLLAYLAVRWLLSSGTPHSEMASVSWTVMLMTWPSILKFQFWHLLLPIGSSEFYPINYVTHFSWQAVGAPVLLLAAAVAIALLWVGRLRHKSLGLFCCLWILFPILPTLYLRALTPGDFVHDRFLYLPSLGLTILIALTIRESSSSFAQSSRVVAQYVIVTCLGAAYFLGALHYQMQWASDILLYQNGLKHVPNSSNLQDNLANALQNKGQFDQAIQLYREVLDRDPGFWRSNYNLGYSYYRTGQFRQAEDSLLRAIQIDGTDADQFMYLALSQMRQGKLAQATANAKIAVQKRPLAPGYHYSLAMILEAGGDRVRAVSELNVELATYPQNTAARDALTRLQGFKQDP